MNRKAVIVLACIFFVLAPIIAAQQPVSVRIGEMTFCTAIEDRGPVGADSVFAGDVGRVFCFTRVAGAADTTAITHVWYHGDEEKARIELPVRSRSWRTWSSKLILESWDGVWRVEVLAPTGRLLISKEFLVRPTE
jgi:hypothetical protein